MSEVRMQETPEYKPGAEFIPAERVRTIVNTGPFVFAVIKLINADPMI